MQGLSRIPSKDAGEGRAQQVRRFHVWPREQTQRPVPGDAREDRVIYLAQVLEKKNAGYFATYICAKLCTLQKHIHTAGKPSAINILRVGFASGVGDII